MYKFFINLDVCCDRLKFFDDSWKRWSATSRDKVDNLTDKKMVSYHNVTRDYHLAKCGCFKSHKLLLRYIVDNKLNISRYRFDADATKVVNIVNEVIASKGLHFQEQEF